MMGTMQTSSDALVASPLFRLTSLLICVLLLSGTFASFAVGQTVISRIDVEGVKRVDEDTIRSYLTLKPGEEATSSEMNASIKSLYATGLFSDVSIQPVGDVLRVSVTENPLINRVAFEGNDKLESDELGKEIQLRSRSIYTRTKVQQAVERILDLYQKNGRFQAQVSPKIIALEQNRVDLVFEIDEGPLSKVQKIYFIGNQVYTDSQLEDVVNTEVERWYRFFSSSDIYDPDRLEYDKELLRRYYIERGYADFKVLSAISELTPEGDGFVVTFTIEEGDRYALSDVAINSEIPDLSPEELRGVVSTEAGETYNALAVEDSIEFITEALGDRGYAFVDVRPDMERNEENDTIALTYNIKEGPRVYVERIDIAGNVRTLDEVVRREFRLDEGDPFSTSKLRRSEQRIRNLGFFERVTIDTKEGSAPDLAVIDVDVEERSTGELTLGAGFSTVDGPLADIGVRENNLLGEGKQLNLNLMLAAERQEIDLGFTEPYFLGRDISAGFDLFSIRQDLRAESSFDRQITGGTLRASYAMSEHLRHALNYTIRQDEVTNVAANASRFIRDQEGEYMTSMVGHTLTYDKRDNRFEPTEGYILRLRQDVAGLGGDAQYLRNEARAMWFHSILPQWVFSVSGDAGYIVGLGEDIRINDRFFIGQRQIRGFNNAGIGPRDLTTADALGGNIYYAGSMELLMPLFLENDAGFRWAVFADVASLWDSEESDPNVVDEMTPRVTVGVGIAWRSPVGPLRLDFGHAIVKESYDETELIRFSFGTRF